MPWKVQKNGERWCVHKENEDGSMGDAVPGGCHDDEAEAQRHARALYANVEEMKRESVSEVAVSTTSMAKGFPDIPLPQDMVFDESEEKPTFVTLKVAEVGLRSNNGVLYDEALVQEIERQINEKRVGGIFGHIPKEKRDHEYPEPAAFWVGAKREGNDLWGKAWVRSPSAARLVQDIKRVGGLLGTSIYGTAVHEKLKDGAVRLKDFILESLDFAPPERASLFTGGQFAVTAEMENVETQEDKVDEKAVAEFLAALSVDQIMALLPDEKRTAVAEMVKGKLNLNPTATVVAELQGNLDSARNAVAELEIERDQLKSLVDGFRTKEQEASIRDALRRATPWNITTDDGKAKYAALHNDILYPAVVAELTRGEPLPKAINTVMETKRISIDMAKQSIAGTGVNGGGALNTGWFGTEFTPEQREDAKNKTGIRFQ